jgi:hypothetical protein
VHGVDSVSAVNPLGLKSCPNGNVKRIRRWIKLTGLAPPDSLGVFNNVLNNGYRAFAERYMLCKVGSRFVPALSPLFQDVFCPGAQQFLQQVVDCLSLPPVATIREVVNAYTGPKQRVYENAARVFARDGVVDDDAVLRAFVKFEKQDVLKAPRVINPRSPVFNLVLGRFLKFAEKRYYQAIAEVFGQRVVVFKGMTTLETAQAIRDLWDDFDDPVAIGADAVKFDMHVHYNMLVYEHLFYLLPYANGFMDAMLRYDRVIRDRGGKFDLTAPLFEQLAWLLSRQLNNVGKAYFCDGKLQFRMSGTRSSGDLNTSLGNCLIMCANAFVWAKRTGVRIALVDNGDDSVYILNRCDVGRWTTGFDDFFKSKGFRMKLEPVVDWFEGIEFCQAHPVKSSLGVWNMVRNPLTLISKASMCLTPCPNEASFRKWIMAVGVCEGSLNVGIPVVQSFASAYRRNGKRCSSKYVRNVYRGTTRGFHATLNCETVPIVGESRLSFYLAFGMLPAEQCALERMYSAWECLSFDDSRVLPGSDVASKCLEPVHPTSYLLSPSI